MLLFSPPLSMLLVLFNGISSALRLPVKHVVVLPMNCFNTNTGITGSTRRMVGTTMKIDTIFALSSGSGLAIKTGVAVIRISGPRAKYCLDSLVSKNFHCARNISSTGSDAGILIPPLSGITPRQASLRSLYCPDTGDLLDKVHYIEHNYAQSLLH